MKVLFAGLVGVALFLPTAAASAREDDGQRPSRVEVRQGIFESIDADRVAYRIDRETTVVNLKHASRDRREDVRDRRENRRDRAEDRRDRREDVRDDRRDGGPRDRAEDVRDRREDRRDRAEDRRDRWENQRDRRADRRDRRR